MKKIIFNYFGMQLCCNSKYHGASEYGKTVLKYLVENYSTLVQIIVVCYQEKEIEKEILDVLVKYNVERVKVDSEKNIVKLANERMVDTIYSPVRLSPDFKTNLNSNIKIKETIHDFRAIELICDFEMICYMSFEVALKNVIKRIFINKYRSKLIRKTRDELSIIDEIFCVSKHTKAAMLLMFPEMRNKSIDVLYSPAKTLYAADFESDETVKDKYILMLGGDRWTKNPFRTITALDALFDLPLYEEYKVVVIGKVSNKMMKKIHNQERFIFKDYLETMELEYYYANCEVFLYTTLNEGFGYPPLEAMKYNKTCIVSGCTSLPEIYGEAVYYVNPYDQREIAEKVILALAEKIEINTVQQKYKQITHKQNRDLKILCEKIIT